MNIEVDLDQINNRYINLWKKYNKNRDITNLYPIQYPPKMKSGSLLFVGCNPSFRNEIKEKSRTKLDEDMTEESFYRWGNLDVQKFQLAEKNYFLSLNKEEIIKDGYFKVLEEVTTKAKLPYWEHIDLFAIRETNQKKVKNALINKDKNDLTEFAQAQIDITLDVIKLLQPKIIVIISAFASHVIKNERKIDLEPSEDFGTYMMTIGNKKTPIFFSGMLARQHALDIFSRERLEWHIRFVNNLLLHTKE